MRGEAAAWAMQSEWRRSLHRARDTDDYVFRQLIPYLGNKRRLLPLLGRALQATGSRPQTFVDLFTGSTAVARFARTLGCRVLANDWEPYSHTLALGTVVPDGVPAFRALGGRDAAFATLNRVRGTDGWVTHNLCPRDDDRPDPDRE